MHVCTALSLNSQTLKIRILFLFSFQINFKFVCVVIIRSNLFKMRYMVQYLYLKPRSLLLCIDFWGQLWWFQTLKLLLTTLLLGQWQSHAISEHSDWSLLTFFNNKYKLTRHQCSSTISFLAVTAVAKERFKMCVAWPIPYLKQN